MKKQEHLVFTLFSIYQDEPTNNKVNNYEVR